MREFVSDTIEAVNLATLAEAIVIAAFLIALGVWL
jgi:hypothetical protein